MKRIDDSKVASILFEMRWKSMEADHAELLYGHRVNMWRDMFPRYMGDALNGRVEGDVLHFEYAPGETVPASHPGGIKALAPDQFVRRAVQGRRVQPREGRVYPSGLLGRVPGIDSENMAPFRLGEIGGDRLVAHFNHPLAGKPLTISAHVLKVAEKQREPGGLVKHFGELLTQGPGFQARWHGKPTDFYADDPFARAHEDDAAFYARPRLAARLDKQAIENLEHLHSQLLHPHTQALDLMSGAHTHIPEELQLKELVGLGMNEEELRGNPRLSSHVVHNVNANPELPFSNNRFDAVLCNASVEYMTRPLEVFADVARVLRPGGAFIVTFSHRWYPEKVVRIWTELHEFERSGLVLDYFLRTRAFERLHTWTERGWPRAWDPTDRVLGHIWRADPLYAVWGRNRK